MTSTKKTVGTANVMKAITRERRTVWALVRTLTNATSIRVDARETQTVSTLRAVLSATVTWDSPAMQKYSVWM